MTQPCGSAVRSGRLIRQGSEYRCLWWEKRRIGVVMFRLPIAISGSTGLGYSLNTHALVNVPQFGAMSLGRDLISGASSEICATGM